MANIEKHQKPKMEQIDYADSSAVPACARASHLISRYIKNRQNARDRRDDYDQRVILRLEDLPATPHNLERIRERVRLLNQRLAAWDAPFRLRLV